MSTDEHINPLTPIIWELIYGEKFEVTPNPNKPENTAYINAMRKQRREGIRRFAIGAGKPLFDEWKRKVRENTVALLTVPTKDFCNCSACMVLREIRSRLELIAEAELILNEEKQKGEE